MNKNKLKLKKARDRDTSKPESKESNHAKPLHQLCMHFFLILIFIFVPHKWKVQLYVSHLNYILLSLYGALWYMSFNV